MTMQLPDRLLHLFGRCNYTEWQRRDDLSLARNTMATRLFYGGAHAEVIRVTEDLAHEAQERLRRHGIPFTEGTIVQP